MDEKELKVLGEDKNYWWFKAKDEILENLTKKYSNFFTSKKSILNLGAGTFDLEFATNYRGLASKLPYNNKSFDVIILADVLEHIPKRDRLKSLKEIKRVMRTNGVLIITVPAHQWLFNAHDKYLGHKLRYDKKTLISHLNKAGLKKNELRYWNCILSPLIILEKIFNKKGKKSDFKKLPKFINNVLYYILKAEQIIKLPFGITIIGVFYKNEF